MFGSVLFLATFADAELLLYGDNSLSPGSTRQGLMMNLQILQWVLAVAIGVYWAKCTDQPAQDDDAKKAALLAEMSASQHGRMVIQLNDVQLRQQQELASKEFAFRATEIEAQIKSELEAELEGGLDELKSDSEYYFKSMHDEDEDEQKHLSDWRANRTKQQTDMEKRQINEFFEAEIQWGMHQEHEAQLDGQLEADLQGPEA